jgi:hypothetical protein
MKKNKIDDMNSDRTLSSNKQTTKALVHSLLDDKTYHIEFNGHLTNHDKHAVVALYRIGATSDQIKSYYENYAALTPYGYPLEAPRKSKHTITDDNWKQFLGKRTSFSSYCEYFDDKEKQLSMAVLLKEYMPTLLPGWAGAFTHATIHLGWALDVRNRWMAIEGLAYMAYTYVSCHPERNGSSKLKDFEKDKNVLDSIFSIADVWEKNPLELREWIDQLVLESEGKVIKDIHPELIRSGLQYRIALSLTEGHALFYNNPVWLEKIDVESIWKELHYAVTLIYMAYPGDFVILHLLTSLHAMEYIAENLPSDQQREVIKCFWIGMLGIIFCRGEFPKLTDLKVIHEQYQNAHDDVEKKIDEASWQEIILRAIQEEEEHNAKMVYVLKRMWKISGYKSIFRIAADHFTKTPELPKTFDEPPVDLD